MCSKAAELASRTHTHTHVADFFQLPASAFSNQLQLPFRRQMLQGTCLSIGKLKGPKIRAGRVQLSRKGNGNVCSRAARISNNFSLASSHSRAVSCKHAKLAARNFDALHTMNEMGCTRACQTWRSHVGGAPLGLNKSLRKFDSNSLLHGQNLF